MARPPRPAPAPGASPPSPSGSEDVLVVPREELAAAGLLHQGFRAGGSDLCLELVARAGRFMPRSRAENDPSRKQVIPYAVVVFEGQVFLFRRTTGGGESRLHGKYSIGVGGHVNPEGVPQDRLVEAGLLRELGEELSMDCPFDYRPVGLINDDRSPVGQVHIGIVYRVSPRTDAVRVREEATMEGRFVPIHELRARLDAMESWSRLVAEALFFTPTG